MQNNQDVKAALIAVNEIAIFAATQFADGVQAMDFVAFYQKFTSDEAFKAKLEAAYNNWSKIPDEIKTMDVAGAIDLAATQLSYIPQLVNALKAAAKPAVAAAPAEAAAPAPAPTEPSAP